MKVVLQRVLEASVDIEGSRVASIQKGLLVLLGICDEDNEEDIAWLCKKIANMRIFPDAEGVMSKSLNAIEGEVIVVSQFTLYASTKKGNRPSYIKAAKPDIAIPIYEKFIKTLQSFVQKPIQTGEFGADMKVSLVNDGPVTIIVDSRNRS